MNTIRKVKLEKDIWNGTIKIWVTDVIGDRKYNIMYNDGVISPQEIIWGPNELFPFLTLPFDFADLFLPALLETLKTSDL